LCRLSGPVGGISPEVARGAERPAFAQQILVTMMLAMGSFEDRRPRPAIGLLVSMAGILAAATIAGIAAFSMPVMLQWLSGGFSLMFWFSFLLLPVLLGLYALLTRLLEQRPLGSVGFAFHPRWKNELATGLIAGTVMMLAVAATGALLGVASFSPAPGLGGKTVLAGFLVFLLFAAAAADEELVFRGYPFQRLVELVGPVIAVIVVAALFGAAHLRNPFQSWISTLNTALVGVLLAICYLRTRALWLPLGIHFAWNFVQGYVLGFPVSGIAFQGGILQAKISGPAYLTGSAYGPEGSILSLGVLAAGTVYFFVSRRIFTTSEMQKLALGPGDEEATAVSISPS
jgi:membrane protease YdiL (CAAX protease family)